MNQDTTNRASIVVTDDLGPDQICRLFRVGAADFVATDKRATELPPRWFRSLGSAAVPNDIEACTAPRLPGLMHAGPAFSQVTQRMLAFAACDANVLILGETGTGKEVCAQAIHFQSRRTDRRWVAASCGAMPNEPVKRILFGHVNRALTNAAFGRARLIREAQDASFSSTTFDYLPLAAQAKLLRFLEEGKAGTLT